MILNLNNIEDVILYDKKLQKLLPEFRDLFGQWHLAQMSSGLRTMGKKAILDLLNSLEEEHIKIIEKHLNTRVTLNKIEYNVVKNLEFPISGAEDELNKIKGFDNFSISRKGNQLYVCFWR